MSTIQGSSDSDVESPVRIEDRFGPADRWFRSLQEKLCSEHPGKQLILNADDFTFVIGQNFDSAMKEYTEKYGPVPYCGWSIYAVLLIPPAPDSPAV